MFAKVNYFIYTASIKPWYSKNYAHEVANAIVDLAEQLDCGVVCIEETWRHKQTTTSAVRNRYIHIHPSSTIAKHTSDKALRAGLLKPRIVYGVSPRRCGKCGNTHKNTRERRAVERCPTCSSTKLSAYVQVPVAGRGVALAANLPDHPVIQFTPATLAAILWGNVTNWNDPAIRQDNPRVALPDLPITLVCLPQSDWCTQMLSRYLRSEDKLTTTNSSTTVTAAWAKIHNAKESRDVAHLIQSISGALGYLQLRQALAADLHCVALQNATAQFIAPHQMSLYPAMQTILDGEPEEWVGDEGDLAHQSLYPLGDYLWWLVARDQEDEQRAKVLVDYQFWLMWEGIRLGVSEHFLPLPLPLVGIAIRQLQHIHWEGQPIFRVPRCVLPQREKGGLPAFRPRQIAAQLRLVTTGAHVPQLAHLAEVYTKVAPTVTIEMLSGKQRNSLEALSKDSVDGIVTDAAVGVEELRPATLKRPRLICLHCKQEWEVNVDWFICGNPSCGHERLAPYNQATVVARLGVEQLASAYEKRTETAATG